MKEKLTLSIDKETKKRAKHFAAHHHMSISSLVEQFLSDVAGNEKPFVPERGSWTESLYGAARLPKKYQNKTYKQIIQEEMQQKYG
jgi:antitoxin component of RelBE/YafQ-DinJ toxin-antitoxin module